MNTLETGETGFAQAFLRCIQEEPHFPRLKSCPYPEERDYGVEEDRAIEIRKIVRESNGVKESARLCAEAIRMGARLSDAGDGNLNINFPTPTFVASGFEEALFYHRRRILERLGGPFHV